MVSFPRTRLSCNSFSPIKKFFSDPPIFECGDWHIPELGLRLRQHTAIFAPRRRCESFLKFFRQRVFADQPIQRAAMRESVSHVSFCGGKIRNKLRRTRLTVESCSGYSVIPIALTTAVLQGLISRENTLKIGANHGVFAIHRVASSYSRRCHSACSSVAQEEHDHIAFLEEWDPEFCPLVALFETRSWTVHGNWQPPAHAAANERPVALWLKSSHSDRVTIFFVVNFNVFQISLPRNKN